LYKKNRIIQFQNKNLKEKLHPLKDDLVQRNLNVLAQATIERNGPAIEKNSPRVERSAPAIEINVFCNGGKFSCNKEKCHIEEMKWKRRQTHFL